MSEDRIDTEISALNRRNNNNKRKNHQQKSQNALSVDLNVKKNKKDINDIPTSDNNEYNKTYKQYNDTISSLRRRLNSEKQLSIELDRLDIKTPKESEKRSREIQGDFSKLKQELEEKHIEVENIKDELIKVVVENRERIKANKDLFKTAYSEQKQEIEDNMEKVFSKVDEILEFLIENKIGDKGKIEIYSDTFKEANENMDNTDSVDEN